MSSSSVQIQTTQPGGTVSSPTASDSPTRQFNFDIARCSRCQRSLSLEGGSAPDAVRFGMNSYYCIRCASMVGYVR